MRSHRKEALDTDSPQKIFSSLYEILKSGGEAVLVTVCGPRGVSRTLLAPGSSQYAVIAKKADNEEDEESLCAEKNGDGITITERFLPHPRMLIFGGGHISLPLSRMASILEFDVAVFDDRPAFASGDRFPWADDVICDGFGRIAERVEIRACDYVVIVTRGHKHDKECLRAVLDGTPPFYAGMIGSRRRVAIVRKQMEEEGYDTALIARLHSPIGLSIGAVTPEEIAVSILAEVIREKRGAGSALRRESYADMELMKRLAEGGERAALVTVLSTSGSSPREAGAKMAVLWDGRTVGSIGGGCAEADVIRDAIDLAGSDSWRLKTVDMTDSAEEDGMVCGGSMKLLIEGLNE
jgi:xanthine dehydrogenase accessory factor